MGRPRGRHDSIFRRLGAAALDAAVLGGTGARWSYHLGLHGTLRVTTHAIRLPAGKSLTAPLVIAFASDFHAGATTHGALLTELMTRVTEAGPDLLLLGGDFVSWRAQDVTVFSDLLGRYQPRLGKYAVMGNHDLWADDGMIAGHLRSAGVEVLVNRNITLPAPFDSVSICGIDDPWTGPLIVSRGIGCSNLPIRINSDPELIICTMQ